MNPDKTGQNRVNDGWGAKPKAKAAHLTDQIPSTEGFCADCGVPIVEGGRCPSCHAAATAKLRANEPPGQRDEEDAAAKWRVVLDACIKDCGDSLARDRVEFSREKIDSAIQVACLPVAAKYSVESRIEELRAAAIGFRSAIIVRAGVAFSRLLKKAT